MWWEKAILDPMRQIPRLQCRKSRPEPERVLIRRYNENRCGIFNLSNAFEVDSYVYDHRNEDVEKSSGDFLVSRIKVHARTLDQGRIQGSCG